MADFNPYTFPQLQANLPDIQKARRRAAELRASQEGFKGMQGQPGTSNFTPTQGGGSGEARFAPVARYRKDYSQTGNNIVGAIGDYTEGKAAGKAEGEFDTLQGQGLLNSAQQYGMPGGGKGLAAAGYQVPPSSGPAPGEGRGLAAAGFQPMQDFGMQQPPPVPGGKQGSPGGFGGGGKQGSPGGFGGQQLPEAARSEALRALMMRAGGP